MKLTSQERFTRMFEHREADRVPILDQPWRGTIERWHAEGMPRGQSYIDYFDLDRVATIQVDNSPRYATKIIEDTPTYRIETTPWGVTLKNLKTLDATPEFLDFTVTDPKAWEKARERMQATPDRIDWKRLKKDHARWRKEGCWVEAGLWFGFDVTHSWMVGTETLLIALIEDPQWCADMFEHYLDVNLKLLEQVLDAGYDFDAITWPDDLGYKQAQFFSLDLYRKLLKPVQKKAIDWAHERGIKTRLHSCGDIRPFIPEFVEIGLDALNPLEVKAGMNPIELKKSYGDCLVLHGGINAVHWDNPENIRDEMEEVIPVLKENGGYIFASDHSIPNTVSLKAFTDIVDRYKKLGSY